MKRSYADTYDFVRSFIERDRFSPTYDEITAGVGLCSKSKVGPILKGLQDLGYITYTPNRSRSIELVERKQLPSLSSDMARLIKVYGRSKVAAEFNRQRAQAIEAEGARA